MNQHPTRAQLALLDGLANQTETVGAQLRALDEAGYVIVAKENNLRPWWDAIDAAVREHPAWPGHDEYVFDDIVTFVERALLRDARPLAEPKGSAS